MRRKKQKLEKRKVGRWAKHEHADDAGLYSNLAGGAGHGWMVNRDGTGEAWWTDENGVTTRRELAAGEGRAMMRGFFGWIADEVMDPEPGAGR